MRTWALLGLLVMWFQSCAWHLPIASNQFPFVLFLAHWLFIEGTLSVLHGSEVSRTIPWPLTLAAALGASFIGSAVMQYAFEPVLSLLPSAWNQKPLGEKIAEGQQKSAASLKCEP